MLVGNRDKWTLSEDCFVTNLSLIVLSDFCLFLSKWTSTGDCFVTCWTCSKGQEPTVKLQDSRCSDDNYPLMFLYMCPRLCCFEIDGCSWKHPAFRVLTGFVLKLSDQWLRRTMLFRRVSWYLLVLECSQVSNLVLLFRTLNWQIVAEVHSICLPEAQRKQEASTSQLSVLALLQGEMAKQTLLKEPRLLYIICI